jgi:hypothetical protein
MQQASATVGTARTSAWPVCNRRCTGAVFTGNSARACPRAATGSSFASGTRSAASAAHYSRRIFSLHANFECHRFEIQHLRRPL